MFENKEKAFYNSEDYTVRKDTINGIEKYYIQFHGQTDSPEYEITLDVYELYYHEFKNTLEKRRDEHRRHIIDGEIDDFIISGKLTVKLFEQESITKTDLETILKTCTQAQQKRFKLYYTHGYTYEQIALLENCRKQRIKKSIDIVIEKIKKYFL